MTKEECKVAAIRVAMIMGAKSGPDGWVHLKGTWPGDGCEEYAEKCKTILYAAGCTHVRVEINRKNFLYIGKIWGIEIFDYDVSGFNPGWSSEMSGFPFHPSTGKLIEVD